MINLFLATSLGLIVSQADGQVKLDIEAYQATKAKYELVKEARRKLQEDNFATIGKTTYLGHAEGKNLRFKLQLTADLSISPAYKRLKLIGDDVILLSATRANTPIALTKHRGYWVWYTQEQGTVEISVEFIVPPIDPRGSIEYSFRSVMSPITELNLQFTTKDVSPKISSALRVDSIEGELGTEISAVLRPSNKIHLVAFRDLATEEDARTAKVYAQTRNLVSLDNDTIQVFVVTDFNILYSGQRKFRFHIPKGFEVLSADGEGAFQYAIQTIDNKTILTGHTSADIRDKYQVSLRLQRPLEKKEKSVPLPLPQVLDVERDAGAIAIEIVGQLAVNKVTGEGMIPVDSRELPRELVESTVSPIARAFRYGHQRGTINLELARYPDKGLAVGGIDQLRAITVLTADGQIMTDLSFRFKNNLRQYLALKLNDDIKVRSASINNAPSKPSIDESGRLLLPLVRSQNNNGSLQAITVQVVLEHKLPAMGMWGMRQLQLPTLEVPISSSSWKLYLPRNYRISKLWSDVYSQNFVRDASWQTSISTEYGYEYNDSFQNFATNAPPPPPILEQRQSNRLGGVIYQRESELMDMSARPQQQASSLGETYASGAMPVRVELPKGSRSRQYLRYWIEDGQDINLNFVYMQTSLALFLESIVFFILIVLTLGFFSLFIARKYVWSCIVGAIGILSFIIQPNLTLSSIWLGTIIIIGLSVWYKRLYVIIPEFLQKLLDAGSSYIQGHISVLQDKNQTSWAKLIFKGIYLLFSIGIVFILMLLVIIQIFILMGILSSPL